VNNYTVLHSDCIEAMRGMAENSVDSIVTDPPYGLSFMGKDWDHGVPGKHFWEEAIRVAKPGAHLLTFGGARTFHRLACAIEDAGWEIRDTVMWVYGCLSDDTEVLTPDGWERYHIARSKEVLAYDPKADVYQWERPERWSEYRVEQDTAYRVESDTTDQIVSRNHRCLVERDGELAFVAAEECAGLERVPTLPGDLRWVPEAEAAALQSAVQRTLSGSGLGKARTQGACGVDGDEPRQLCGEDDRAEQPCVEGRLDVLQEEGQVRQPVDQIRSMPRGVCCDGSQGRVRHGAPLVGCYGVGATAVAERVCASLQPPRDGQQAGEPGTVCIERGPQAIRARTSYQTTLATFTPIEYSGLIFCPTVSTGAFVARRNGKVFVTGNSGFPKSLDVSKAIDKAARGVPHGGVDPTSPNHGLYKTRITEGKRSEGDAGRGYGAGPGAYMKEQGTKVERELVDAAKQWQGWGTALKPAFEPIILARKPLIGTVAQNVIKHGTGAINVDGCRVPHVTVDNGNLALNPHLRVTINGGNGGNIFPAESDRRVVLPNDLGRWPANLIHDGSEEVLSGFPESKGQLGDLRGHAKNRQSPNGVFGKMAPAADHPMRGDSGSAARFFYCSKAGKKDRGEGNNHPTVKPTDLMRYLCRLVTPPNGIVLDPFMGSGSTGKAAILEGFRFIGIERDEEYFKIAESRIKAVKQ